MATVDKALFSGGAPAPMGDPPWKRISEPDLLFQGASIVSVVDD
jgi:hypothetical protein